MIEIWKYRLKTGSMVWEIYSGTDKDAIEICEELNNMLSFTYYWPVRVFPMI